MEKKRSVVVVISSIFLLLYGIVTTLFMTLFIVAFLTPDSQFSKNLLANINIDKMHNTFWAVSLHEIPICLVYMFLGVFAFVSGIGILRLQDWGRKLFMLLVALDMLEAIINSIFLKQSLLSETPWLIFDCVVLFYFTRPKVKEQFK